MHLQWEKHCKHKILFKIGNIMNDVKPVEGIYQGNVKVRLNPVKKIPLAQT